MCGDILVPKGILALWRRDGDNAANDEFHQTGPRSSFIVHTDFNSEGIYFLFC